MFYAVNQLHFISFMTFKVAIVRVKFFNDVHDNSYLNYKFVIKLLYKNLPYIYIYIYIITKSYIFLTRNKNNLVNLLTYYHPVGTRNSYVFKEEYKLLFKFTKTNRFT